MGQVGFVGLGEMGLPIAQRLLATGHEVVGYDTSQARVDRFAAAGGIAAGSVRDIGDRVDLVFACLPNPTVSLSVANDIAACEAIRTYVETSTIGPKTIMDIEARLDAAGIGLVDAPVSGGIASMARGTAAIAVSGRPEAVAAAMPRLMDISSAVSLAGDKAGHSQICKLVNNAISFTAFLVSLEAFAVGIKAGVKADTLLTFVNNGSGRNSATVDKIPRAILPRTFNGGGRLGAVPEVLGLYLDLASDVGMPDLSVKRTLDTFKQAIVELGGDVDYTLVAELFERLAEVEIASGTQP